MANGRKVRIADIYQSTVFADAMNGGFCGLRRSSASASE